MNVIRWVLRHWALLGLASFAVAFWFMNQSITHLHERAKFTLGTIDGWRYTANSGRFFGFSFQVAGVPYGGSSKWKPGMLEADGSRCLVEYDSLDPAVNVGHFDVLIPDSVQAPANGWRVPPVRVPAWLLSRGGEGK